MSDANSKNRPNIWKTICDIDDSLLPFICGAIISTGLSTMLESSFEWKRFLAGFSMFLASALIFWWYVCLAKIKREISRNVAADEARKLSDGVIWDKYHKPRRTLMRFLVVLTVVFVVIWGVFLFLSYSNNASTRNINCVGLCYNI